MNTQTKTTEQYFPVVLFIMLYKVFLTFESVEEIPKCYHSNEIHWAVPSCSTVYYAVQGGSNFWSVDEILECDHSNESYWAVLSCGTVYTAVYAVQGGSYIWVGAGIKSFSATFHESYWDYFAMVLSILVYKLSLAFEFVDEIFVLVNKLQVNTYVKTKQPRMDLSHPLPLRLVVL